MPFKKFKKVKAKTKKDQVQDKKISKIESIMKPELKGHYVSQAQVATTTTLTYYQISQIPCSTGSAGFTTGGRIGNKVRVKGITIHAYLQNTSAAVNYIARLILVRSAGAANPATDSNVLSNGPLSFLNTQSMVAGSKFQRGTNKGEGYIVPLYDSGPILIQPWSGTATGYISTNSTRIVKIRVPCNFLVSYESATTADPVNNDLNLIVTSNNGAVEIAFDCKVDYEDN